MTILSLAFSQPEWVDRGHLNTKSMVIVWGWRLTMVFTENTLTAEHNDNVANMENLQNIKN